MIQSKGALFDYFYTIVIRTEPCFYLKEG